MNVDGTGLTTMFRAVDTDVIAAHNVIRHVINN
jgi:hypothetical protein